MVARWEVTRFSGSFRVGGNWPGRADPTQENDKGLDVAFAQQLRLASSTPELILPTLRSQTKNALLRRVSCARSDSFAWAANYLNETSEEKEDEVHREVPHSQRFCR